MHDGAPRVSIIVPVLNESATIGPFLDCLETLGAHEVLLVDGGSTDDTVAKAKNRARILIAEPGRARQMNEGARHATGDTLVFLHADVRLRPEALQAISRALQDGRVLGGNFNICYSGNDFTARIFNWINRTRCHFGIFYGDSGIFCRRDIFKRLGGYPEWPILEDYAFARRLWRSGKVQFLKEPIYVSDRRWRNGGLFGTLWSWFWIMSLYLAGVSPHRLARLYRNIR